MSFNLYLSSLNFPGQDPASLEYTFNPPIQLDGPYEMACVGGKIINSIPNVSSSLNNNTLRYSVDGGGTWHTVTLPEGSYQTTAIETEVRKAMDTNGDFTVVGGENVYGIDFKASNYLLRFQVILKANVQLDLSIGELYKLLGFSSPSILDGGVSGDTFTAPNIALFTTGGENYYIQTDIVRYGMAVGSDSTNIAGVIRGVESTALGYPVNLRDPSGQYPYFPVNTNVLRTIRIRCFDGLGRQANFRGEAAQYELRFRKQGTQ